MIALESASDPDASLKLKLKRLLDMTGGHAAARPMSLLVVLHITAWEFVLTICDRQPRTPDKQD